jgi:hypothetical protein
LADGGVVAELDATRFGIKMKKEIPMVTVERTYTSPIWYTPYYRGNASNLYQGEPLK